MFGDFYKALNISRSATLNEIKVAYRKLALQLHPDKTNGDPAKTAKYRLVSEAYATLSNNDRRKEYDRSQGIYRPSSSSSATYTGTNSTYARTSAAEKKEMHPDIPFSEAEWNASHYPEIEIKQARFTTYKAYTAAHTDVKSKRNDNYTSRTQQQKTSDAKSKESTNNASQGPSSPADDSDYKYSKITRKEHFDRNREACVIM